jgi:adenylylsulfate kinase-like enzyme
MRTLWLLGLPFSGKTTLAHELKERTASFAHVIDQNLIKSYGLVETDERLKSMAFTCKQLNDSGVYVINCLFTSSTAEIKKILGSSLTTIYLDSPKSVLSKRMLESMNKEKSKLYLKHAESWKKPEGIDFHLDTFGCSVDECVRKISHLLSAKNSF